MRVLEPTLIISNALLTVNNGGGSAEVDFDFGNLEGALLIGIDWYLEAAIAAQGELHAGLNLDPDAADPTASTTLALNNLVIAYQMCDEIFTTSGASMFQPRHSDLRHLDMVIARNVAVQAFEVSANNRSVVAKIYYKRVQFTPNEVGPVITFRR